MKQVILYQGDILDKLERVLHYCEEFSTSEAMTEINDVIRLVVATEHHYTGALVDADLAEITNPVANRNLPYETYSNPKDKQPTMELFTYIKPTNGTTIKLYSFVKGQQKATWYYHGEFNGNMVELIESLRMRREELARQ